MYVNIYFNENEFNKKERVDNIKMIENINNQLFVITEEGDIIKYLNYNIDSYMVVIER